MEKKQSMWRGRYLAVIVSAAMLSAIMALRSTCLSVFVTPMAESFSVTTAQVLVYSTISCVVGLVSTPLWGKLCAQWGLVKCVLISGVLTALSMIAWSFCNTLITMYIAAGFLGLVSAGCGTLPAAIAVTMWFEEKRGTAMGIVIAFLSVGGMLGSAILPNIIIGSGWQTAMMIIAVATAIGTIPFAFLLKPPAAYGMLPFGHIAAPVGEDSEEKASAQLPGISVSRAMRMPLFYILWIGMLFLNFPSNFMANLPTWGVLQGFDLAASGMLVSYACVAGIIFTILVGVCNDKLGPKFTTIIFLSIGIVGILGYLLAKSYAMAVVVSFLWAIGLSYVVAMPSIICVMVFGQRDYSQIYANITLAATVAAMIGAPAIALLQNISGSYNLAFIILGAMWILTMFIVLYSVKKGSSAQAEISKEGVLETNIS